MQISVQFNFLSACTNITLHFNIRSFNFSGSVWILPCGHLLLKVWISSVVLAVSSRTEIKTKKTFYSVPPQTSVLNWSAPRVFILHNKKSLQSIVWTCKSGLEVNPLNDHVLECATFQCYSLIGEINLCVVHSLTVLCFHLLLFVLLQHHQSF